MKSAIIFTIFTALAAAQVTRDNDGYGTTWTESSKPTAKPSSTSASVEHYPAYSAPATTEEAQPTSGKPDIQNSWSSDASPTGDNWGSATSTVNSGWPETYTSAAATGWGSSTSSYAAVTSSSAWTHSTTKASSTSASRTTSATASAFTGAAIQGKDAVFGFGMAVAGAGLALVL